MSDVDYSNCKGDVSDMPTGMTKHKLSKEPTTSKQGTYKKTSIRRSRRTRQKTLKMQTQSPGMSMSIAYI